MVQTLNSRSRAIALVDGEHYLSVVRWALDALRTEYDLVGAVFLGGTEKVGSEQDLEELGIPVIRGADRCSLLREAIARFSPEVAVDLSDEPVVGYRERFEMASLLLHLGVRYIGADFAFSPPHLASIATPALSIVGTGKRTGKTAIAAHTARVLRDRYRIAIVTMGRGGPPEPEVLDGEALDLGVCELLDYADRGFHAASGCFGHAFMTRVLTIGCRRCGGGMSGGEPFFSNVIEGARLADGKGLDLVLFDGSGATAPPVRVDRQVLIVGAHQPVDYIRGYFGPFRILRSHAVIVTGCEPPLASAEKVQAMTEAIAEINPQVPVFRTVFRLRPVEPIEGARVFLAVTSPPSVLPRLAEHLEEHYGCRVVGTSPHLSNRPLLRRDLKGAPDYDVLLTELKAAGVDVAARSALSAGRRAVFVDVEPVSDDMAKLDACLLRLADEAIHAKGPAHG